MIEQGVTFINAPEKLAALGQALGVDTRTKTEIRRQELQAAQYAANAAALHPPFSPLNVPG